jgi:sugar lactone lactonase YvrE
MRFHLHVRSRLTKLWRVVVPCAALLGPAAGCLGDATGGPPTVAAQSPILAPPPCQATNDIVVIDRPAQTPGELIRIDPATGKRSLLSANDSPSGGLYFEAAWSMAYDANGKILVLDAGDFSSKSSGPRILRVDPVTGARSVLSSNSTWSKGPDFADLVAIAVESDGRILALNGGPVPGGGALLRVDPGSGSRTLLSQNGAPVTGPEFEWPVAMTASPDGDIYLLDVGMASAPRIIRVDPKSGARTLISTSCAPGGEPSFQRPTHIAVDRDGAILVSDVDSAGKGVLIKVDRDTGTRTKVPSGKRDTKAGFLVPEACGGILSNDAEAVYRIDPAAASTAVVSDNSALLGMPYFSNIIAVAAKAGSTPPVLSPAAASIR